MAIEKQTEEYDDMVRAYKSWKAGEEGLKKPNAVYLIRNREIPNAVWEIEEKPMTGNR